MADQNNNQQGKSTSDEQRGHSLHVVQDKDRTIWVVKTAETYVIVFESEDKTQAQEEGKRIAEERGVKVIMHNENGKIESQEDYGGHKEVRGQ